MKHLYLILALLGVFLSYGQGVKKVFFIGNSYTDTHNIPELTKLIANGAGDQLTYTSHAPGGATLQQHNNNAQVNNTIAQGNWDYVVLQEQSQLPAFPDPDVLNQVYPYATALSNKIKQSNPCTQVTFYMTWGRKNGDQTNCAFWPPLCTYLGMDNLLQQRYMTMATTNKGIVAPVAAVWRYLITNHPEIDLYSSDESHPSIEGAMAAAYTFYTIFFKNDPNNSNYTNNLPPATITAIKKAVHQIVYSNLTQWKIYDYDPVPKFDQTINGNSVTFNDLSLNTDTYLWDFGDGTTSALKNPNHTYTNTGNFVVKLSATKCNTTVQLEKTIAITTLSTPFFQDHTSLLYPNPASDYIQLNTAPGVTEIAIIDAKGKTVFPNYTYQEAVFSIDIRNLASGTYYLKTTRDGKLYSYSFIKK